MYAGQQGDREMAAAVVLCEIRRDNVVEIVFLEDGTGVARLGDGSSVEFFPGDKGAYMVAVAAEKLVPIRAAEIPDIPVADPEPVGETGSGTAGRIALGFSLLFGGWFAFHTLRSRRVKAPLAVGRGRLRGGGLDIPATRFSDVAGSKEAIEDLREMVDVLCNPERYQAVGARTPRGALLIGPPGTGKPLLARAVAGESGVPFYPVAGSDFVEMYVGVGPKRVREVFAKAKKHGRAIVFIDEIDAVGRKRSGLAVSGGEQENENTLVALLNELDGFTSSGVVVLAATNRPDVLDEALCRPGRLDRRVYVGLPDLRERSAIAALHLRGKPLEADVSADMVARKTAGMSGAQIEQVCNEAALLAARAGRKTLTGRDLADAAEYVAMGRARHSALVNVEDRLVTAWHEAGHAVAALRYPNAPRPLSVSIVPRGVAGGSTWLDAPERMIVSRPDLKARLVVALAGRAGEELYMGGE